MGLAFDEGEVAFSELRRPIQEVYLRKVLLRARRGYITFNDIMPADYRSHTLEELTGLLPGALVLPEEPLTHPRNRIIVWGVSGAT